MCCLRLGRELPGASKRVWKKLKKSTKVLHKLIIHKSSKLPILNNKSPSKYNLHRHRYSFHRKHQPLFLSPRRRALKKKKSHPNYCTYLSPRQPPIYLDDLFSSSSSTSSSSSNEPSKALIGNSCSSSVSSSTMLTRRNREEMIDGNGSLVVGINTSPSMGIDERAELFIASFRAQLDQSFSDW